MIQLSGYTYEEKLNIAQAHLIPKQIKAHGLNALQVPDNVVMHLSERYTRESGVRNLDRLIAGLCRYKCREFADLQEAGKLELFENCIDKHDVEIILGVREKKIHTRNGGDSVY